MAFVVLVVRHRMSDTRSMLLVVPDAGLDALLRSPMLIEQMWPGASREVMVLFTFLMNPAFATLREVLLLGLVGLMTPAAGANLARISLSYRSVVLVALAGNADWKLIESPYERLDSVEALQILDVAVGGRAALKAAV